MAVEEEVEEVNGKEEQMQKERKKVIKLFV